MTYTYRDKEHTISPEEIAAIQLSGPSQSIEQYLRTPSIPHRDQLMETKWDMLARPDRVKPRLRPTEEARALEVKYWLKAHHAQYENPSLALCGKERIRILQPEEFAKVARGKGRICRNCLKIFKA